ncbi:MAG TPA: cation transporter [Burkholderiaceae bacterium]|nr:cation transporter [Burkholderiaceae bacterium]
MKQLAVIAALVAALPAVAGNVFQTVTLDVQNMTCASCPLTVRQILKKQPGVEEAKVDLRSQSAQVKFDPAKVQPEQLAKAVSEAGYPSKVRR